MLIMFDKLFQLKEFITYDSNAGIPLIKDFMHQINLGDHNLPPTITLQKCLEMSMVDYNLKFKSTPSPALIIQIPRHHSGVIQSTTIIPNLTLNLDNLLNVTDGNGKTSTVMNLTAVIAFNDFHFTAFVKCGTGILSHWVLFDSSPSDERPKVS